MINFKLWSIKTIYNLIFSTYVIIIIKNENKSKKVMFDILLDTDFSPHSVESTEKVDDLKLLHDSRINRKKILKRKNYLIDTLEGGLIKNLPLATHNTTYLSTLGSKILNRKQTICSNVELLLLILPNQLNPKD